MEKEVKKDILSVLKRVYEILKVKEEKDILELKGLSNRVIHNCCVYHDIDSVQVAILVYSVYKILDRGVKISKSDYDKLKDNFKKAHGNLRSNRFGRYNRNIETIFDTISSLDKKGPYIQEVIEKARIKKGSKIFQHGLSAARAADIIGITKWQLLKYMGKTKILDEEKGLGLEVKKRFEMAKGMFRI